MREASPPIHTDRPRILPSPVILKSPPLPPLIVHHQKTNTDTITTTTTTTTTNNNNNVQGSGAGIIKNQIPLPPPYNIQIPAPPPPPVKATTWYQKIGLPEEKLIEIDREGCVETEGYYVPDYIADKLNVTVKFRNYTKVSGLKRLKIFRSGTLLGEVSRWDIIMMGEFIKRMKAGTKRQNILKIAQLKIASLMPLKNENSVQKLSHSTISTAEETIENGLRGMIIEWFNKTATFHSDVRNFVCPHCGLTFPSMAVNLNHIKKSHIVHAEEEILPALNEISAYTKNNRQSRLDNRLSGPYRYAAAHLAKEGDTGVSLMLRISSIKKRERFRTVTKKVKLTN